jgi:uncharacterized protein YcbX
MNPVLSELHIYPVKGARGIAVQEVLVEPRGLADDRRFMLVDADGQFVTQRSEGRLAQLVPRLVDAETLSLALDGVGEVRVPRLPCAGPRRNVQVWRDQVEALDVGAEAADFLAAGFGKALRLVFMREETRRRVDPAFAAPDDVVSFADGFPFLLTAEASLRDLQERVAPGTVPMARFRPNFVVRGTEPFAEHSWSRVRIGELRFEVCKPCTRCVVVTRDQRTGESQGKEPLRTLSTYRTWNNQPIFGENLLNRDTGVVRVGMPLRVDALRDSPMQDGSPR